MRATAVLVLMCWLAVVGSATTSPGPVQSEPPERQATARARPGPPAPSTAGFESVVKPFVSEYCFPCHGKGKQENDLNLQAFESAASLLEHRDRWEEVAKKLRASEMPPLEEEQPEEEQRQAVATWLEREYERIDRLTPPDPGRVTARRLNRNEYNNTIRDLLGVDVKPADDFPQDDSGYGFDNIADVLSLSPVLMEKYVAAADRVTRLALFGPPPMKPTLTRLRSDGRRVIEARTFPESYDVSGLSLPNAFHAIYRAAVDGEYMIRVALGGVRPANSAPITVALWIDHVQVGAIEHDPTKAATFGADRQDLAGQAVEFRVPLTAGDRWVSLAIPRIYEGLPARLNGPNPSTLPDLPRTFTPPPDAPPERVAMLRKRFEQSQAEIGKLPLNGPRVSNVDIGGPYTYVKGPSKASLEKIYTCGHQEGGHQPTCLPRIMTGLATRAFRRPVRTREIEKYLALARQAEKEEGSLAEGLAVGIQALLVSPDFLFRIERDRPASAAAASYRLTPHELASRLAYFLWASMPDDELRRAADTGTLRDPTVLAIQVRRMLRDPRSRALAQHFGGQWLQFRALESVTRDRDRFPQFEDYLRLSMRHETEAFFDDIVRNDRSILDFVEGKYSFLNERLARHYGVDGVTGPEFRRVDLTGLPRAGVLTHGSVLTVSSYATRTSPVLRGKWILENLLDAPPPEPPADVPNLDETT
ncbi:MAG TPA: DUF1592 domain-containing protein, partial [Vicinamibacterales bacterium]|nr:DUF1592 domain-containing protein [Vicinamibacterales bacterium]